MATTIYAIQYLGAIRVTKNTPVTTASIFADSKFTGATVAKLSTDLKGDRVGIIVNQSPIAKWDDGDEQFIITGHTFEFDKDCTIKIGIYKAVV